MNYNEMIEKWAEEQGIELNQEPNLDNLSEEDLNAYKTASEMMDEAIERIREAEEYYEACVDMQKEAEEDYAACEELYADVEKRASACEYIYNNVDEDALTEEFLSSEAGEELCDLLEKTASVAEGVQEDRESIESYASELVDHYNYAEEVMKLAEEQYQEAMEVLELAEKTAIEVEAKAMYGEDSEEKLAALSDYEDMKKEYAKQRKVSGHGYLSGILLGEAAGLGGQAIGAGIGKAIEKPEIGAGIGALAGLAGAGLLRGHNVAKRNQFIADKINKKIDNSNMSEDEKEQARDNLNKRIKQSELIDAINSFGVGVAGHAIGKRKK